VWLIAVDHNGRRPQQVLIGSGFSKDATEYHLISQINAVKRAMQLGKTVILLNCDNLYEVRGGGHLGT
jgi:hypothetical protein